MNKIKLVEGLKRPKNKKKHTFALSQSVAAGFQKECDRLGVDYGPTVERLMIDFITDDRMAVPKKKKQ